GHRLGHPGGPGPAEPALCLHRRPGRPRRLVRRPDHGHAATGRTPTPQNLTFRTESFSIPRHRRRTGPYVEGERSSRIMRQNAWPLLHRPCPDPVRTAVSAEPARTPYPTTPILEPTELTGRWVYLRDTGAGVLTRVERTGTRWQW